MLYSNQLKPERWNLTHLQNPFHKSLLIYKNEKTPTNNNDLFSIPCLSGWLDFCVYFYNTQCSNLTERPKDYCPLATHGD